jgi:hypothetical protein
LKIRDGADGSILELAPPISKFVKVDAKTSSA